jgi:hypothetical protein
MKIGGGLRIGIIHFHTSINILFICYIFFVHYYHERIDSLDYHHDYNHDKLSWIGVSPSHFLSKWVKDNMANVNPYSSIWYNIPNKELYYEGLALNKECFSILETESISVENPVRKNMIIHLRFIIMLLVLSGLSTRFNLIF